MEKFLVADLGFFQTLPGILLVIGCVIAIVAIIILLIPKKDKAHKIVPDKIEQEGTEIKVDIKSDPQMMNVSGEVLEDTIAFDTFVDQGIEEASFEAPMAPVMNSTEPAMNQPEVVNSPVLEMPANPVVNEPVMEAPVAQNVAPMPVSEPVQAPVIPASIEEPVVAQAPLVEQPVMATPAPVVNEPQPVQSTMYGGFDPKPNTDLFKEEENRGLYGGYDPKPQTELIAKAQVPVAPVMEPIMPVEPTQAIPTQQIQQAAQQPTPLIIDGPAPVAPTDVRTPKADMVPTDVEVL